ncbi:MAG TPA: acetyltransferase [Silvibacterium sp.]|nr:acetyltransferase [Silvibacterium sp.]
MKGRKERQSAIVYGASGHGKVVADILHACGIEVEGFVDDDPRLCKQGTGLKILGDARWLIQEAARRPLAVALGIGDNFARRSVAECVVRSTAVLITAVHPSATISPSATICSGTVIMPHAVVNAGAVIECGAIINTAAIVEHDCIVGSYCHLSPHATIGGHVEVGELAWLGIGSSVIPEIKVGRCSIVGAGATVISNIDEWVVTVGTPARTLKKLARAV